MASLNSLRATRVLLVEDHPVMRAGVRSVLAGASDIVVVGEAETGGRCTELVKELAPDVVILDIGLPDVDGLELLHAIRAEDGRARVIMYTCQRDGLSVDMAMERGASGYLTKSARPQELVEAVRQAMAGRVSLSAEASTSLVSRLRAPAETGEPCLTAREREVWTALADGLTNAQIAGRLFISESTVKFHVHNLLRKLGMKTRAEAICAAHRRGLGARS